jgi:TonB family protein
MAVETSSHFPALTYHGGSPGWAMQRMLVVSLVVHVTLIMTLSGLRIAKMERPLASYEVSLVTMPVTPHVEPVVESKPVEPEPPKAAPAPPVPRPPQPQIVKEKLMPQPVRLPPAPAPRMRPAPPAPATQPRVEAPSPVAQPTPPAASPIPARVPIAPSLPVPRPAKIDRDALRGIALPPEVPKFTDMQVPAGTPREARSQPSNEVEKLVNNLTVPERATPPPPSATPASQAPPQARRASVTEDEELKKQLQKLREPIPLPPPAPSRPSEPVVASKPPAPKAPTTRVQMAGVAAGNPYLGLIQKRISNQWIAPQVDLSGSALQVIIKFRLNKSGQVADIVVEQSSGNEYYDMAAKRAVMAASPLPAFPPDMGQAFFDAHFSFSVGEQVS